MKTPEDWRDRARAHVIDCTCYPGEEWLHADHLCVAYDARIRAEVRAETLAGFEWEGDGEIGPCVNTDHADAHAMPGPAWSGPDCRHERQVTRRRLVGPWEPDTRTPEQRSDDAITYLKHRLGGTP